MTNTLKWHHHGDGQSTAWGHGSRYTIGPSFTVNGWRVDYSEGGTGPSTLVGVTRGDRQAVDMAERHNRAHGGMTDD